ncbi:putative adenosine monophosphate-protein transferase Fic [Photobacterium lutimaris]|uniref:protein adenylyltransferase n=1 Tax=Photobacterium lutimaris TaxID=388278 RepID=A0A2T3J4C6_9GAMM|nr:putative adenosine monophosphate-protein transferase Fic [Photobacterium lutimaris]PSU36151.1 cell filamentation protein Fic [Photobacterium lutimaris]TDR79259.1 cell filamentation protein [Photobacterium lutimaris]
MPDRYGVDRDPDCYPNSTVLINLLNIRNEDELEAAERDFTRVRASHFEPDFNNFTFDYLKQIHHILFQDLYPWAGIQRTVDITKGETRFCHWENIERESNKLLNALAGQDHLRNLDLNDFIDKIAFFYCELNVIHPFREGNGRVQRIFFEILAINAGYEICWEGITLNEWVEANQAGYFGNMELLHALFERITTPINLTVGYSEHWSDEPKR